MTKEKVQPVVQALRLLLQQFRVLMLLQLGLLLSSTHSTECCQRCLVVDDCDSMPAGCCQVDLSWIPAAPCSEAWIAQEQAQQQKGR